ncbi:hypothetical protein ODS41_03950 [Pyrobaculum sp. 3827-6]|uniref:hypothetical protein n=1 Tax=Pyrobaculum sp. 3827-6 TaxID=2983604 RepID=UPI0021D8F22F|nr:hypothetical protein [Pyrobaculum sp. 3827-6]MCU7787082.1 hypothetical protein [Pyrobaculum sp. 3827-6]
MQRQKLRGLTTVEALLIAAGFIIVGVIGALTFSNIGKSASEALRVNAIATADKGGFDVTIEVLNGKLTDVKLRYGEVGGQVGGSMNMANLERCFMVQPGGGQINEMTPSPSNPVSAGQSITCRFSANLETGRRYTYVILAGDESGKTVQVAKGVVTVGIS